MRKGLVIALLLVSLVSLVAVPATSEALGLGDVLKVGGIGYLVDRFAGPLNNFINSLMMQHNAGVDYATKVVPILSLGSGGYIGAAQVMGDADKVDETQAVLQVEGNFNGSTFRVKALIPIDSKNPTHFSRVQGVGISAVIDVKI